MGLRHCGGLPVLVHVVSQRAKGLRLREVTAEVRDQRLWACCLPYVCTGCSREVASLASSDDVISITTAFRPSFQNGKDLLGSIDAPKTLSLEVRKKLQAMAT